MRLVTNSLGYQQITSLGTAVGMAVPAGATMVLIVVEGGSVRWRDDNVDPTAAVGMPIFSGASMNYEGPLSQLKFISSGGTPAVNITYYN